MIYEPCYEDNGEKTNFLLIHSVEVEVNHSHQLKEKGRWGLGLLFRCSGRDSEQKSESLTEKIFENTSAHVRSRPCRTAVASPGRDISTTVDGDPGKGEYTKMSGVVREVLPRNFHFSAALGKSKRRRE